MDMPLSRIDMEVANVTLNSCILTFSYSTMIAPSSACLVKPALIKDRHAALHIALIWSEVLGLVLVHQIVKLVHLANL